MPQMMPLNWLILFYIFSTSLIFFNVMNFFMFSHKIPLTSNKILLKTLIWKW
uniref:ATP synthase F0 subunit 8 n=1 Tax=Deroplatys truncata TaxID=627735 RepID=UPI0022FD9390|nr:ATP synthase F0 subunit 8 [Deroplatys truncata]UIX55355.1 ATP synthase F0 subunit 8 [Deroplatys truncata]